MSKRGASEDGRTRLYVVIACLTVSVSAPVSCERACSCLRARSCVHVLSWCYARLKERNGGSEGEEWSA